MWAVVATAGLIPSSLLFSESRFSGDWCVSGEGLVISFYGKDSLKISNLQDEGMNGIGAYVQTESTLVASVANEELELEMAYQYKWQDDTLVRARIMYFTVNGDSVNHPQQWMRMARCQLQNSQSTQKSGAGASDAVSEDKKQSETESREDSANDE